MTNIDMDMFKKHIEEIKQANILNSNRTYMNKELQKHKGKTQEFINVLKDFTLKNGHEKPNTEEKIKQLYIPTSIFNSVLNECGFKTQVKILEDGEIEDTVKRNIVSSDITAIRNSINELEKNVFIYARKNSDYKNLRVEVKE